MSITSTNFIFILLPLCVLIHSILPMRARNYWVTAVSLIFYWFAGGKSLYAAAFLCIVTLMNWLAGIFLSKIKSKLFLGFMITVDALSLAFFKYLPGLGFEGIVMPLGISFFTFKNISYLHETYTDSLCEGNPVDYFTYAIMFPQIMQGPIQTWRSLREQLHRRRIHASDINDGLKLYILGFAIKELLSVKPQALYNSVMNAGFDSASTTMAWLCALAFSLCLYFDFYGYSLMAEGIGKMLGFTFCKNFDEPYASKSVSEFWRRWHSSLGEWFKENIYFPMGGSRVPFPREIFNLLVVWFVTGIWHGTGVTYIIWAAFSFILIVLEKNSRKKDGPLYHLNNSKVGSHIYIILYSLLSWAIFMAPSNGELLELFKRLFPFFGSAEYVDNLDFVPYLKSCGPAILGGIFVCTTIPKKLWKKVENNVYVYVPLLLILFWVSVYIAVGSEANPFMYVNF